MFYSFFYFTNLKHIYHLFLFSDILKGNISKIEKKLYISIYRDYFNNMKIFPALQNNSIKYYFENTYNLNRNMMYLLWFNFKMNTLCTIFSNIFSLIVHFLCHTFILWKKNVTYYSHPKTFHLHFAIVIFCFDITKWRFY